MQITPLARVPSPSLLAWSDVSHVRSHMQGQFMASPGPFLDCTAKSPGLLCASSAHPRHSKHRTGSTYQPTCALYVSCTVDCAFSSSLASMADADRRPPMMSSSVPSGADGAPRSEHRCMLACDRLGRQISNVNAHPPCVACVGSGRPSVRAQYARWLTLPCFRSS